MRDLSDVGNILYEWDFDEEEFQEWIEECEIERKDDTIYQYIDEGNVYFNIILQDNDYHHEMERFRVCYDEMLEILGEKITKIILKDCMENGNGEIEMDCLYDDEPIDINNPEELNARAILLLKHGDYFKDCRGFILTNGTVVYTEVEHNQCTAIDGIKNTYHFISLGNIRVLANSIDLSKPPTPEQRYALRQVISEYSDDVLYLDIMDGSERGATYYNPDWRFVLGEIDRYFREGIAPQGNTCYEGKKGIEIIITENQYKKLIKML